MLKNGFFILSGLAIPALLLFAAPTKNITHYQPNCCTRQNPLGTHFDLHR